MEVTLIPRIASAKLAPVAFKSLIKLLYTFTVVAAGISIPFTAGDVVEMTPDSVKE